MGSAARDVLARFQLPDGRLWADAAEPFQLEDAIAVLEGERPYNFLTRSRGSSKTTDLSGLALAMLLGAEGPARIYWCAADSDQGTLAIDAMAGFLNRNASFAGSAEVQARRVVVPETGARIEVLPADAPGAWGLNPDAVFVDELANWHDGAAARRLWEAVSSAVAKREDARLVVLTTAGSPDHFARKVLDHALDSPLWRVHEIEGPAPWIDPERIEEQRQRLPHSVFEQLWMNRWTVADGAFLDPAVIDAAFCLDGPGLSRQASSYVAALDVGVVHDATAFAIGHRDGEEVHLDRLQTWQGSRRHPVDFEAVEQFIVATHQMFRFEVSADPWQALDLCQRLRKRGIRVSEFSFGQASKQKLASTLLHSLNVGHLKLYEAEGLRDELMALRLKQSVSGTWSFDHQSGGHDDRAVALALMTVAALQRPGGMPTVVSDHPWAQPSRLGKSRGPRQWRLTPELEASFANWRIGDFPPPKS